MDALQINNIEQLINLEPDQKIVEHKVKRLTAIGENYGSLMLSVDLTVKTKNGIEHIYTVVKMVPPNDFIQEIFNTQVTFRNEIAFYKNIVPTLQNFQRENGFENVIDFAPRYYGSRLNLNDDDTSKVDSDAALVLENLKLQNYVVFERTEGLDLDVAKLILSDLAHLHAVSIGLKIRKPDIFEKVVKANLQTWFLLDITHNNMKKQLSVVVDGIEQLHPLKERILTAFDRQLAPQEPREPFATIAHNDSWTNNNLVKLDGTKPVKNKIVDYQICNYGSPARDVIFFLFSSVKNHLVEKYFDDLVRFYHDIFISVLKNLKCDTAQFSFEALQEEIDLEAYQSQFGHVAFMLFPIFALKEKLTDIAEFTPENFSSEEVSDLHKEKLIFIVEQFVKRQWI